MNRLIFHWSSEIYGLGLAYRYVYRIPKIFPLPFFSDHGVIPSGVIDEAILNLPVLNKTFLTFSHSITRQQDKNNDLRIIGQIHPWVIYKEKKFIKRDPSPSKVIFFPLHTVEGYDVKGMDDNASIDFLNRLNEPKQNILVCLHWNDLHSKREEFFRNLGFQVINFGDPMSYDFIDNFYKYAVVTKYAISESWTSGLAFLIDLGVPCQIIPRYVEIESNSELNKNVGFSNPEVKNDIQESESMFLRHLPYVSDEQRKFVEEHLGYAFRNNLVSTRRIILSLYFTSLPNWFMSRLRLLFEEYLSFSRT